MTYYGSSSTHGSTYDVLDACLRDILSLIKPLDTDQVKRWNTINELVTVVQSVDGLRGADVKPFGSYVSNLYTKWGDLDISVELSQSLFNPTTRKRKQYLLRELIKALRRTGIARDIQIIANARVPLVIFKHNTNNISCDVSIDNYMGHIKSKILLQISEIDERFRDMILLTKEWAKTQNINDPKSGTLNSHSLCLLVIFHFQTCKPAILPPLKEIYGGNISDDLTGNGLITERHIEDVCAANILRFKSQNVRRRNQISLSELLISFFEKFSRIGSLSSEYVVCTYTGQWERITSKPRWADKPCSLLVEDPFEQPQNAARAVGLREINTISNAFQDAYLKFSNRSLLMNRNYILSCLVRYSISSQLGTRTNHYASNGSSGYQNRSEFRGYTTTTHDQFQSVPRLDRQRPSSSSSLTLIRQGASNIEGQPVWKPRFRNL